MGFKDKYISQTDKTANQADTRIVLSDDAYAITEMIDILNFRISRIIK